MRITTSACSATLLLVLVAALGLAACGESKHFTSQIESIAGSLGKSTSLSDAKAQLTGALQQLATAYNQSFARVDCG
jgi:hypothetical protein